MEKRYPGVGNTTHISILDHSMEMVERNIEMVDNLVQQRPTFGQAKLASFVETAVILNLSERYILGLSTVHGVYLTLIQLPVIKDVMRTWEKVDINRLLSGADESECTIAEMVRRLKVWLRLWQIVRHEEIDYDISPELVRAFRGYNS